MKRTKSMIYKESAESKELMVCTINNGDYYLLIQSVVKSLAKKAKKGVYDSEKAIDAWYHVANHVSKWYYKNFGYMFTVQERFTAAVDMEKYYRNDVFETV
jgi:hypothetical protein